MNKDFLRLLKEKDWVIPYNNSIKLNTQNIDGWPDNLDTENLYFEHISSDEISGKVGGDWQDLATFNLIYRDGNIRLVLFDSYTETPAKEIKKYLKEIYDYLTDTQSIKESIFNSIFDSSSYSI